MRIIETPKLDFNDVLFVPKRSTLGSRSEVALQKCYHFRNSGREYHGVPIVAANMDGVGTFKMAKALGKENMLCALSKHYTVKELVKYYKGFAETDGIMDKMYSMGITDADLAKFDEVKSQVSTGHDDQGISMVCIDVANGYNEKFIEFCARFREANPRITIMAGNVVTPEVTEQLLLSGVDIVKVGIGSGAQCTTRIVTGVGYPQLSAVIECADAAHGLGGHIVSDGGIVYPGDVAKAFGAGADFVMIGSMFAGHDEGGGRVMEGKVVFYGMSSQSAQSAHNDDLKGYRASEGRTTMVKHKGPVANTLQEITGGLRSCCTYVGARSLKELPKRATFITVNRTHNTSLESSTIGK